MPTENAGPVCRDARTTLSVDLASLRTLRLALGTALSFALSQASPWTLSYIAPIITMYLLALPLPAPRLKGSVLFSVALIGSLYLGLLLLPLLSHQRAVGVLLMALALFHSFYYTARGGSPVVGAFATIGLAVAAAIGSVSIDAAIEVAKAMTVSVPLGILFVWLAHLILPDSLTTLGPPLTPPAPPGNTARDLSIAHRGAFRSLAIVLPVMLWLLLSSGSTSHTAVLIKVATMGQQAGVDQARTVAKDLLLSTLTGGIAAIIGWEVLRVWPSLTIYVPMIGLAGLVFGRRIFSGAGLAPAGPVWSYGFLTMLIILMPAAMDSVMGNDVDTAFWNRMEMFIWTTLYGIAAVLVFDALWPLRPRNPNR